MHALSALRPLVLCGLRSTLPTAPGTAAQRSGNVVLWIEREVAILYGDITPYGLRSLLPSEGPHPAIAFIAGVAPARRDERAARPGRTSITRAISLCKDSRAFSTALLVWGDQRAAGDLIRWRPMTRRLLQ